MTIINYSPGCFGKLPKFADFVKFNSGNNELFLFDKWLQNGIQYSKTKLSANFDSVYSSADTIKFVFPIQESTNTLLGTFISSTDKSGRKYPFIISAPTDISVTHENMFFVPQIFEEFYLHSEKIISQLKDMDKLEDIIYKLKNEFYNTDTNLLHRKLEYQEYTSITTMNKLWNRLFGNFEDDRKYLLIYNLKEILLPLKDKQINNCTLGLKIPIERESEFMYPNICFWIEVCLRFIGNLNIRQYLFWFVNSRTKESSMVLFFNQPPHDNYTHFIDQSHLMDNICQTEKEGNIENCMLSLSNDFKSLLECKDLSLAEFLNNI